MISSMKVNIWTFICNVIFHTVSKLNLVVLEENVHIIFIYYLVFTRKKYFPNKKVAHQCEYIFYKILFSEQFNQWHWNIVGYCIIESSNLFQFNGSNIHWFFNVSIFKILYPVEATWHRSSFGKHILGNKDWNVEWTIWQSLTPNPLKSEFNSTLRWLSKGDRSKLTHAKENQCVNFTFNDLRFIGCILLMFTYQFRDNINHDLFIRFFIFCLLYNITSIFNVQYVAIKTLH